MKATTAVAWLLTVGVFAFAQELPTMMTADRVNVRDYPSLTGKIVSRLNAGQKVLITGMCEGTDVINGRKGYWLRVDYNQDKPTTGQRGYDGWVYAQYAKGCNDLTPRGMEASDFTEHGAGARATLLLTSSNDKGKRQQTVYLNKVDSQEFYTFSINNRVYDERPGTYAWFPTTNEIRHVTVLGYSDDYVNTTDDMVYAVRFSVVHHDIPGLAGVNQVRSRVEVWSLPSGKPVFDGFVMQGVELEEHSLDIVCYYIKASLEKTDAETETHAVEFTKDDSEPWQDERSIRFVIVGYKLNLDTMKRELLGCRYDVIGILAPQY